MGKQVNRDHHRSLPLPLPRARFRFPPVKFSGLNVESGEICRSKYFEASTQPATQLLQWYKLPQLMLWHSTTPRLKHLAQSAKPQPTIRPISSVLNPQYCLNRTDFKVPTALLDFVTPKFMQGHAYNLTPAFSFVDLHIGRASRCLFPSGSR